MTTTIFKHAGRRDLGKYPRFGYVHIVIMMNLGSWGLFAVSIVLVNAEARLCNGVKSFFPVMLIEKGHDASFSPIFL